jgi:aldehyde dehydrogenase (NAD+)
MAVKTLDFPFKHNDSFFIGGEWMRPSSDAKIQVICPTTEEVYVSVAEAQEADINRAVAAARQAFDHGPWPRLSHAERGKYLRAIGRKLDERAADIAQVWPNEMGIIHSVATAVSGTIGAVFDYYADLAGSFAFEERHHPAGGGEIGLLVREPVGVVGAIIPWNGPIILMAWKLAPALLAGCTVIIKASPEGPGAAYILAEIIEACGLPPGVVNVVTADRAVSELLVRHADVDKISFTGSTAAGRRVASICGDRVARCTLELGGKSAALILDDCDIATAARSIADMACFANGQACSSLTRIVVPRHRHDAMVEALAESFGKKRVGDPFDPTTELGPLVAKRQRDRIEQLMAKGKSEGSVLAAGGGRPAHLNAGFFIDPTVFGNVDNDSTLAREELFGPVLSVIPVDNEEHGINIANDTEYGLNNSVFTDDPDRAYAVARRLRSGTVGHNVFRTDFSIAFGGFKKSGIGREGGTEGLLPYLESKTIILNGIPKSYQ